jgi:hypothetical protein
LQCGTAPTSYTEGGASCAGGSVSSSGSPYAATSASFVGIGDHGSGFSGGSAQLTYDVIVNGGNPGDAVPVFVEASLFTDALGGDASDVTDAGATISLSFANGNSSAAESVGCGNVLRGTGCSANQWSGTLHATAWVGYDNLVTLESTVSIAGAGFARAYADPHIYIDPAFAELNPEYSLQFNVSNDLPASAPEPSSWLLGIAGLTVLALRLRSQRSHNLD